MKKMGLGVFVAVLLGAPLSADIIQQVLVKVNGDIITKTDLEQRQVAALRQRNQQFPTDDDVKRALAEITPQVIAEAVDELLLQQRGRELGYRLTDDRFHEIVEQIRKENKLETDEQFEGALKQEGMTLADLRKALERQMLVSQVQQQEVMGKIGVSEEEAQAYYAQHADEFKSQPTVTLREILVSVPTAVVPGTQQAAINVGQDDAAKARAEAIRARIAGGEDFARIAGEESDAPSKANGGLIGPIRRDELAPALVELLQKMKPGDFSEPMRTTRGYQLIKLETSTPEVVESFAQARDKIAAKVFAQKRQGEFEKYLAKLRGQAIIEWKNPELKKAFDQFHEQRAAKTTS